MNINDTLKFTQYGLPEDIRRCKEAGFYEEAIRLIDCRLAESELPEALKGNLLIQKKICQLLPTEFPYSKQEALDIIREKIPAFTEDEGETWTELSPDTPVSMNFWGFGSSFMDAVKEGLKEFFEGKFRSDPLKAEYFLPTVVEDQINAGKAEVKVLRSSDKWYGVTYKEDKETVVSALQSMKDKGLYPEKLWN